MRLGAYDPYKMTKVHMLDSAIAYARWKVAEGGHLPTNPNTDYPADAAAFDCFFCSGGVDIALNSRFEAFGSGRILTQPCEGDK